MGRNYKMIRIFLSYTTRSSEINIENLKRIENVLNKYGEVYIELLDCTSDKSQEKVLMELKKSDVLLLVKTAEVHKSKWVNLELEYASNHNIPIFVYDFVSIINEEIDFKLEQDLKINYIT